MNSMIMLTMVPPYRFSVKNIAGLTFPLIFSIRISYGSIAKPAMIKYQPIVTNNIQTMLGRALSIQGFFCMFSISLKYLSFAG